MLNPAGHHVNTWTAAARHSVRASPGGILKILNTAVDSEAPDELRRYKGARPDGLVVARMVFGDESLDPIGRCETFLRAFAPVRGQIDVAELPWNESHQSGPDLPAYAEATLQATDILESEGFDTCVGNFSAGNPWIAYPWRGPTTPNDWPKYWKALAKTRRKKYLGLHEYGAPRLDSGSPWTTGRYALVRQLLPAEYQLDFLIGEFGIDGGMDSPKRIEKGWRTYTTALDYANQMRPRLAAMAACGYIRGVAIFACGTYAA